MNKVIISINVSNQCNLKCHYCPHSLSENPDLYELNRSQYFKNIDKYMEKPTMNMLMLRLKEYLVDNYKDNDTMISITGFGEPLLNPNIKHLMGCLSALKKKYKDININLISNGVSNPDLLISLISDNYTIEISQHPQDCCKDYVEKWNDLFNKLPDHSNIIIRHHEIDENLKLNNRGGLLFEIPESKNLKCYYPLYEISIDYDGSYLICAHDWSRLSRDEEFNINKISIYDYLTSSRVSHFIKQLCINKNRSLFLSCKYCNVFGTTYGKNELQTYENKHSF